MLLLKCADLLVGDFQLAILVITVLVILEFFVVLAIVAAATSLLSYITLIGEDHDTDVRSAMFLNFLQPAIDVLKRFAI